MNINTLRFFGLACLAALPALAQNTPPAINKVRIFPGYMIIDGTNFGVVPPTVTICGGLATLTSNGDTYVGANLPPQAKEPGTCLLKLTNNTMHGNEDKRTVTFNATIPTSQKAIALRVESDGHNNSAFNINTARFAPGMYNVNFPSGTWQGIYSPAVVLAPVSGLAPNLTVTSYSLGIDGSLNLIVTTNAGDIPFFVIAMQG